MSYYCTPDELLKRQATGAFKKLGLTPEQLLDAVTVANNTVQAHVRACKVPPRLPPAQLAERLQSVTATFAWYRLLLIAAKPMGAMATAYRNAVKWLSEFRDGRLPSQMPTPEDQRKALEAEHPGEGDADFYTESDSSYDEG